MRIPYFVYGIIFFIVVCIAAATSFELVFLIISTLLGVYALIIMLTDIVRSLF